MRSSAGRFERRSGDGLGRRVSVDRQGFDEWLSRGVGVLGANRWREAVKPASSKHSYIGGWLKSQAKLERERGQCSVRIIKVSR